MRGARFILLMGACMLATSALGFADAQTPPTPNRLGGASSGSSSEDANATASNNATTPTNASTETPAPPAPTNASAAPTQASAPDGTSLSELGSTGLAQAGSFVVDVCLKSYRSYARPHECAWKSEQRMYDRFWFVVHANKPFRYEIWVDGQSVATGQSEFRIEWNSSTTKQSINLKLAVTEMAGQGDAAPRSVEYVYDQMRVRASGVGGEEDDEDVEGSAGVEEKVPISLVRLATAKAVIGACIAFLVGMPLAYATWEEKDARMSATLVLGS